MDCSTEMALATLDIQQVFKLRKQNCVALFDMESV